MTSTAFAAAVRVGGEAPAHLTAAGHVTSRPPVPSWVSFKSSDVGPGGAVNVGVTVAAFRVIDCRLPPVFQLTAGEAPELPIALTANHSCALIQPFEALMAGPVAPVVPVGPVAPVLVALPAAPV